MPRGIYERKPNIKQGFQKGNRTTSQFKKGHILTQGDKNAAWIDGRRGKKDYQNKYQLRKKEAVAGRKKPEQCEVCGAMGTICFDHNHETNRFRGWICTRCNTALGYAKDSPELLRRLADYLEK